MAEAFVENTEVSRAGGKVSYMLAIAAVVCVASLLVWSAYDASFSAATWVAKVNLGIDQIEVADLSADILFNLSDRMMSGANKWDHLGKRVAGLYLVYGVGMLATVLLLARTARRRNTRLLVISSIVVTAWTAFFATRTTVEDWRCVRQINAKMNRFEQVATTLSTDWPTESTTIEPIGRCIFSKRHPGKLVRHLEDKYPIEEDIGMTVDRGEDGVIRFSLAGASETVVEYHPNGTEPTAFDSGYAHWKIEMLSSTRLKPKWYLVRFTNTLVSP